MLDDLTPEEKKAIKELAQNMLSASRVGRLFRTAVIWLATAIGGGYVVWDFVLKPWGKS